MDEPPPNTHCPSETSELLADRVGLAVLQQLQDRFAELGQVTVCMTTVNGRFITSPTWGSVFSRNIGLSDLGSRQFARAIEGLLADPDAPAPQHCHEGMTLYAAPIVHEDATLGMIIVGPRVDSSPPRKKVNAIASIYGLDPDELWAGVNHIDPYRGGSPESTRRFAESLAETIATMYGQSTRIEAQLADLRVVHELSELLAVSTDAQEILDRTVARVVEVMKVKAAGIRLLNEATGELVVRAVCNLSDSYLAKGPVMLSENSIDREAFEGKAVHIHNVATDRRIRYPQQALNEGIVSGLCVPMTYHGQTVGVIRVYTDRPSYFSDEEESLLRSLGSQAAAAVINSQLYDAQARADRYQRQVEAAGQIQRRMLPRGPAKHQNLEFACLYEPTLQVGGDFFDFIRLTDGRLGMCIADVVGKGLPAALMMASARAALRALARDADSVADAMQAVNHHVTRETLVGEFVTMFYGVFSLDGRTFTYCNAGHPPPILLRGGTRRELLEGGLVLGVDGQAAFDEGAVSLEENDLIVLTTDGVSEAMNFSEEFYGSHRLMASIEQHRDLSVGRLSQQLLWDVRRFVGLADQSDDITIVVVRAV